MMVKQMVIILKEAVKKDKGKTKHLKLNLYRRSIVDNIVCLLILKKIKKSRDANSHLRSVSLCRMSMVIGPEMKISSQTLYKTVQGFPSIVPRKNI